MGFEGRVEVAGGGKEEAGRGAGGVPLEANASVCHGRGGSKLGVVDSSDTSRMHGGGDTPTFEDSGTNKGTDLADVVARQIITRPLDFR